MRILYLATMRIVDKWTMPIMEWGSILDNLVVFLGDQAKIFL